MKMIKGGRGLRNFNFLITWFKDDPLLCLETHRLQMGCLNGAKNIKRKLPVVPSL